MSDRTETIRKSAEATTRELAAQGRLLEGGWRAFLIVMQLTDAPQIQRDEMRRAFFAGAQHLFASMNNIMDEDREPTDADLHRVTLIHEELEKWVEGEKIRMSGRG